MAKKQRRSKQPLVIGFMEKISSKIFSDFPKEITDLIGVHHGVYALYKGKSLYYVGLASDLRGRVKQHLRDKHAGKWDKFSVYLVRDVQHIKELEALTMRIASPKGNTAKGRLPYAENLKRALGVQIRSAMDIQLDGILGGGKSRRPRTRASRKSVAAESTRTPTLAAYITKPLRIRGSYKGEVFYANVNKSGSIRFEGNLYTSPSMAGKAARKRSTNGWVFWHYRNSEGEWVRLDELRK